jgi:hypothetical protein
LSGRKTEIGIKPCLLMTSRKQPSNGYDFLEKIIDLVSWMGQHPVRDGTAGQLVILPGPAAGLFTSSICNVRRKDIPREWSERRRS